MAAAPLTEFDAGYLVGLLIGEGHFGGDGRQPQITLRMHTRHVRIFEWLVDKFPDSKLYGPYTHGGRSYYQWMARGAVLRDQLVPLLDRHLTAELDEWAHQRYENMKASYGLGAIGLTGAGARNTATRRSDRLVGDESESVDEIRGPAVGLRPGRLADDDEPARPHERRGGPERRRRRGKAAGDDRVGAARAAFGKGGRVDGEHLDAVGEGEPGHETPKVIGTARATVDEHHPQVGPRPGDHEARDSTAAAEIDDGSGDLGEGEHEGAGVLDHLGDGAVPEHAQALGFGERGGQLGVAGDVTRR